MTTTRITSAEYAEISDNFSEMLGRLVSAHPCPLSEVEMVKAWENTLPKDYVQAYRTMEKYNLRSQKKINQGVMTLVCNNKAIYVRFHAGGSLLYRSETSQFAIYEHKDFVMLDALGLDDAKREAFIAWLDLCDPIRQKSKRAMETIHSLLGMAATVGQMNRMAPDLVRYMSERYIKAANEQQRRSPLSPEWSSYPRARVEECVNTLALCHLLEHGKRSAGYVDNLTWAWIDEESSISG